MFQCQAARGCIQPRIPFSYNGFIRQPYAKLVKNPRKVNRFKKNQDIKALTKFLCRVVVCSMAASSSDSILPDVIELNVGGVLYTTLRVTLARDPSSVIGRWFAGDRTAAPIATDLNDSQLSRDSKGRFFIDRDGVLFRFVLDYLRNGRLVLPESFAESVRLRQEADFYGLSDLAKSLPPVSAIRLSPSSQLGGRGGSVGGGSGFGNGDGSAPMSPGIDAIIGGGLAGTGGGCGAELLSVGGGREQGYIVVGYRGTFQFGRDGLTDVKFRKISRILVSGRVSICRDVFGDTLNESRDPDRGTSDRYSARFFLKHAFIEQAFDALQEAGFRMAGACGSGTNSAGETKPGMDSEENRWNHYNEFVFCRP